MGRPAARVGDAVGHSLAAGGLMAGALAGALLGVAVVATGGLAAVAAGAMIAGGVAGGALAGGYIGAAAVGAPTGAIVVGSPNVFINGRPAALVLGSSALCAREYGVPQPVAQGAATVFINGLPAARLGDQLACGAQILQGSDNVFLGDETMQALPIAPEVPLWLNRTLEGVAFGAAVLGFGAAVAAVGFGAASVGLAGSLVGGALGGQGGRVLGQVLHLSESATRALEVGGGAVGGLLGGAGATRAYERFGANAQGVATPDARSVCTNGCPISMHTGEELLALTDFTWAGPLSLAWTRLYRTAQSGIDLQLGHGWLTPLDEWIEPQADGSLILHDREGRRIALPLPAVGGHGVNTAEGLRVERTATEVRIRGGQEPDRCFVLGEGRSPIAGWRRAGHRIDIVRDASGQALRLEASWGKALLVEREGHRIARLTPARLTPGGAQASGAPLVRYVYHALAGDLAASLDRLDHGERYAYDGHLLVRRTLASGFAFHFDWDRPGPGARCVRNWGDHGIYDFRFAWDPARGASRVTDSRGGVTDYVHDAGGRLRHWTSPEGRTRRLRYDARGLLAEIADADGTVQTRRHDDQGRLVEAVDAQGHAHSFAHDARGRLIQSTDPLGRRTHWEYDDEDRPVRRTDAAGGVTSWRYNALGLLERETNPAGQVRLLWWDTQCRLIAEIGFDGVPRYFSYDADDRLASIQEREHGTRRFDWDAAGRLRAHIDETGRQVHLRHDAAGRLTHWSTLDGATFEYRYDVGLSQPSERIDALGQRTRYEYDSERNLVGLVNAKGERHRLAWDLDERLIAQQGLDGRRQRYRYDALGHLCEHEEAFPGTAPAVTRFERDRLGRLRAKTSPDGAVSHFDHDALGRLTRAAIADHEVAWRYDAAGRVLEERQGDAAVRHEYDALGRRLATRLPDGRRLGYVWSRYGRVEQVLLDGLPVSTHRWDLHAREAEREQGELTTRYAYDPAGRLTSQSTARGRDPVLGRDYRHDIVGRIDRLYDLRQGDTTYRYDLNGQLTSAFASCGPFGSFIHAQTRGPTSENFVHDPAGNLLPDGLAHVEGDRLLVHGDRHLHYDAAGNRVQERRGTGHSLVTTYDYDASHRLIAAHTPRGSTRYRYDALGRRIAKTGPQGQTRFYWDGATLLGEEDAHRRRWYVYEPGSFRPLACIATQSQASRPAANEAPRARTEPEVYHYHLDHLGTPREMTDARGRIVWSARYRAFGALALADVQEIDNPLRFQGQYHDVETGLHYNLHRYYDPATGHFLTQDPIGLRGGANLYRYTGDPVQWVDPLGLSAAPGDCGVGGIGDAAPGVLQSGARQVLNPGRIEGWDAAGLAYDAIRANPADVGAIAKNAGLTEATVARIKAHVFENDHLLDCGRRRFDADPDIVNSWDRLTRGDFVQSDLDLLAHERFETKFESIFQTNYRTAHEAAIRSGRTWVPE